MISDGEGDSQIMNHYMNSKSSYIIDYPKSLGGSRAYISPLKKNPHQEANLIHEMTKNVFTSSMCFFLFNHLNDLTRIRNNNIQKQTKTFKTVVEAQPGYRGFDSYFWIVPQYSSSSVQP